MRALVMSRTLPPTMESRSKCTVSLGSFCSQMLYKVLSAMITLLVSLAGKETFSSSLQIGHINFPLPLLCSKSILLMDVVEKWWWYLDDGHEERQSLESFYRITCMSYAALNK